MSDIKLNKALLRSLPLPEHGGNVDKDARGRALAIGGCTEMPGALLLSGVAALRAGAGKLQMATCASVAPMLALAVPEALVVQLTECDAGSGSGFGADNIEILCRRLPATDAILVGPGLAAGDAAHEFTRAILSADLGDAGLVLDAAPLAAIKSLRPLLHQRGGATVLTPHAGEMAAMLGINRDEVLADPAGIAARAAADLQAIIVLEGPNTVVAAPDGRLFRFAGGGVGLATLGSGDTLAGIALGLMARGAPPLSAAIWAVYVHGKAGKRLGKRIGRVGFLARELLAEVPRVIASVENA
ncbi:ADP-dependent (S)-NAD(P)H-hydrate dehydratase [Polymorphobacter glacialis]|uniref:ADP-dependent (S)-NAD(P)H-hydrate dehydratase n=1 Tax=Sandarakinorhabdus glacialis TaxID=1614636 RepID=A0A916ZUJ5_9SPHN|nr:NAD(P)H-hydrate dehydratase [Polymorphobacter glacialis]GGE14940.1 ADP-dependent (S)-NAD(P)H-hydrate dehydratase [Polymorphobacter glacialis]